MSVFNRAISMERYESTVFKGVKIAASANITDAIDISGAKLVGVFMPAAWDAADLTFQASYDGSNFFNVYDDNNTEVNVKAAASRYLQLKTGGDDDVALDMLRHLKIRSGTNGTPVTQTAARILILALKLWGSPGETGLRLPRKSVDGYGV